MHTKTKYPVFQGKNLECSIRKDNKIKLYNQEKEGEWVTSDTSIMNIEDKA